MLNDLTRLLEFFQNFSINLDLKQYRPQRRPLCLPRNRQYSEAVKRKRRLLVRDWFFYVVWYVRLRRLLNSYYMGGVKSDEEKKEDDDKPHQSHFAIRCQALSLKVFDENLGKFRTREKETLPAFEFEVDHPHY